MSDIVTLPSPVTSANPWMNRARDCVGYDNDGVRLEQCCCSSKLKGWRDARQSYDDEMVCFGGRSTHRVRP